MKSLLQLAGLTRLLECQHLLLRGTSLIPLMKLKGKTLTAFISGENLASRKAQKLVLSNRRDAGVETLWL